MTDVEGPQDDRFEPPDTEESLLRLRDQLETARSVPDVGVGHGEPGRPARCSSTMPSAACPRSCARPAGC